MKKFTPLFKNRVLSSKFNSLKQKGNNKQIIKIKFNQNSKSSLKRTFNNKENVQKPDTKHNNYYQQFLSSKVNQLRNQVKFLKQQRNHDLELLRNKQFKIMQLTDHLQKSQIRYYMLKKKYQQLKRKSLSHCISINQSDGDHSTFIHQTSGISILNDSNNIKKENKIKGKGKGSFGKSFYSRNLSAQQNRFINTKLTNIKANESHQQEKKLNIKREFSLSVFNRRNKMALFKTCKKNAIQQFRIKDSKVKDSS